MESVDPMQDCEHCMSLSIDAEQGKASRSNCLVLLMEYMKDNAQGLCMLCTRTVLDQGSSVAASPHQTARQAMACKRLWPAKDFKSLRVNE